MGVVLTVIVMVTVVVKSVDKPLLFIPVNPNSTEVV